MWELYLQYEADLRLREPFNPLRELELKSAGQQATGTVTTQQLIQQMQQLAGAGIGLGAVNEEQLVKLAAAMIPFVGGSVSREGKVRLDPVPGAYMESVAHSDVFKTDFRLERSVVTTPTGPQEVIKHEVLWQRWEREQ